MSGFENITGRPQVNGVFVNFVRFKRFGAFGRITITPAHDSIGQKSRIPIRGNIDNHCSEIGIRGRTRSVKLYIDKTGSFDIAAEGWGRKDQDILTRLIRPLIEWTGSNSRPATKPAAQCWYGGLWVIFK